MDTDERLAISAEILHEELAEFPRDMDWEAFDEDSAARWYLGQLLGRREELEQTRTGRDLPKTTRALRLLDADMERRRLEFRDLVVPYLEGEELPALETADMLREAARRDHRQWWAQESESDMVRRGRRELGR